MARCLALVLGQESVVRFHVGLFDFELSVLQSSASQFSLDKLIWTWRNTVSSAVHLSFYTNKLFPFQSQQFWINQDCQNLHRLHNFYCLVISYSLANFSIIASFSSLFNEKIYSEVLKLSLVNLLSLMIWLFANGSNRFL